VGLALSPDGRRLFATSERMQDAVRFPVRCQAESAEEGGDKHSEGGLSVIDVARARTDPAHALLAVAPAGCNPVRVALTADGSRAYVTARGENAVYGFDVAGLTATPPAPSRTHYAAGDSPVGIAVQPAGGGVWVSDSNRFSPGRAGEVQSVPLTPDQTPVVLKSGAFPRDLRFLPDGKTLVVGVFGSNAVQLIPTP
jgi:DNA-binding beta-propeller fold protein YncE